MSERRSQVISGVSFRIDYKRVVLALQMTSKLSWERKLNPRKTTLLRNNGKTETTTTCYLFLMRT